MANTTRGYAKVKFTQAMVLGLKMEINFFLFFTIFSQLPETLT